VSLKPIADNSGLFPKGPPTLKADPAFALVGSLILQGAAVATLVAWLMSSRQSLDGPHFVLLVLFFVAASEACPMLCPDVRCGASPLELLRIALRWLLICAVLWIALRLAGLLDVLNQRALFGAAVCVPLVLWGVQWLLLSAQARRVSGSGQKSRVVVIGVTEVGIHWASRLAKDVKDEKAVTFFDDRHASRLPAHSSGRLAGNVGQMSEYVRANNVQSVYITLPISRHERIVQIIKGLGDCTASIYFVPDLLGFDLLQARVECIHGIPLLAIRESPFVGMAAVAKRVIDVAVSGAALVVLAVPMLALAVLVKLTSKGPAIFRQRRYGLNGEEIYVLKFRTMGVMEDGASQYVQAARNDTRVTRVGAVLRATSFDELPQLINVFMGSMSIVGPRPHAIAVNERYRALIPNYMVRHKVKPGITGLAQINGCRGGDDLESMTRRIQYDLTYLRHWSIGLDLWIMLRTVTIIWTDRHAY
jgi:putative colanic acid biosysnthesis UDP-glucose lipid carrier transferase